MPRFAPPVAGWAGPWSASIGFFAKSISEQGSCLLNSAVCAAKRALKDIASQISEQHIICLLRSAVRSSLPAQCHYMATTKRSSEQTRRLLNSAVRRFCAFGACGFGVPWVGRRSAPASLVVCSTDHCGPLRPVERGGEQNKTNKPSAQLCK